MENVLLNELREIGRQLRSSGEIASPEVKKKTDCAINTVLALSKTARRDGLSGLEEQMDKLGKDSYVPYLQHCKKILSLMTDGVNQDAIRDIMEQRFFVNELCGVEGLIFLMYMEGLLGIWNGENPRLIEERMKNLMPRELLCEEETEENVGIESLLSIFELQEVMESTQTNSVAEAIASNFGWDEEEDELGSIENTFNILMTEMQDKILKEVLKNIDHSDLSIALMRATPETKEHVFANLPKIEAEEIAFCMLKKKYVSSLDTFKKKREIIEKIDDLVNTSFITLNDDLMPILEYIKSELQR